MMDNWSPMAFDYHDKQFNSYDRGPGKNLPGDPAARQNFTNLYVTGVPEALNEDGIRNLFGKCGTVKSCRIRRTPNYVTSIAFVMMETLEQCSEAIHMLNGHKIGNDRLSVKFAKTAEEKEKDRREKAGQDKLIKSLGSGRTVTNAEGQSSGSLRVSISNTNSSEDKPAGRTGPSNHMGGGDSQRNASQSFKPISRNEENESGGNADIKGYIPNVSDQFFHGCERCDKGGCMFKCANCLVWYCSAECQSQHWPIHKPICMASRSPGATTSFLSPPPVTDEEKPQEKTTPQMQTTVSMPAPVGEKSEAVSIILPLNESIKVKLVEFQSPAKFFVQLANNVDMLRLQTTLNQAIECSLYGLLPFKGGMWTDFAVQACTKHGLVAGDLYSLACVDHASGNQVLFALKDGSDLGDRLVQATAAVVDPSSKYRVWDSLHRHLSIGTGLSLKVESNSVEGVGGFYASIGNDELKPNLTSFSEMEGQMTLYGKEIAKSNVWNERSNRLPELGQHVLCEFMEDWSRAEVVQIQDKRAVVAFLDYGNLHVTDLHSLLHMPRQFSHLPAVAVKTYISGVKDLPDAGIRVKAADIIKESFGERILQAVVKDYSTDALSLQISMPTGADLATTLLSANLAMIDDEPLQGSLLSAKVQAVSPQRSAGSAQITPVATRAPMPAPLSTSSGSPLQAITSVPVSRVSVDPLMSVGNSYTVRLRKLDGTHKFCVSFPASLTRRLDQLRQELSAFYSNNNPGPVTPCVGDYVVFHHPPEEWRRGLVKRTATSNRIALVLHLDFEHQTTKISFDSLRPMLPTFAAMPYQALPVCQLQNVTEPQEKNALLKPYMHLPVNIKVLEYTDNVYTVTASHQGEPLCAAPERKSWFLGNDVKCMEVPPGQFDAQIVDAISPQELFIMILDREGIESCLNAVKEAGAKAIHDVPPEHVKRGEVILMFVPGYEEWDRAVVLDTLPDNELSLQSLDFGSKFEGNLSNARSFTEELAKKPQLAIQCSLTGWSGTASKEACSILDQLKGTVVAVEAVSRSPTLQVRMSSAGKDVFDMVKHVMPVVSAASSPPVQPTDSKSASKSKETGSAERLNKLESLLTSLQAELVSLREERNLLRQERED